MSFVYFYPHGNAKTSLRLTVMLSTLHAEKYKIFISPVILTMKASHT